MRNRNVLVFDFDGVIIDNTLLGYQKTNQILAEMDLPPVPEDFLRARWGMKADDLSTSICKRQRASIDQLIYFKERTREININATLDKRLAKILVSLPATGFFMAILTSRGKNDLRRQALEVGLDLSIFDYIQTINDYTSYKPDGDVFKPLIQRAHDYGFNAKNIAYFGDTIKYDYAAVINSSPPD